MFFDVFLKLCADKGITPTAASKAIGFSKGSVSYWRKNYREGIDAKPDSTTAKKISDFFGVSVDYLLDHGSPVPPGWVPVVGRVAAGIPIEAIEDVVDMEQLAPGTDPTFEYRGLVIHGDSMEPRMKEGDVVIVRIQDQVEDGDTAVVFVNGDEATCKKIKITPEGVFLISNNPAYEPMFLSRHELERNPLRVFGKVVELRAKF